MTRDLERKDAQIEDLQKEVRFNDFTDSRAGPGFFNMLDITGKASSSSAGPSPQNTQQRHSGNLPPVDPHPYRESFISNNSSASDYEVSNTSLLRQQVS